MWSGESKTFQPTREQTGVLQPQNARGRGDFREYLIYLPASFQRLEKSGERGRDLPKVTQLDRVSRNSLLGKEVRIYIFYFTIVTESQMTVSKESRKL